jgi:hypothetical protein
MKKQRTQALGDSSPTPSLTDDNTLTESDWSVESSLDTLSDDNETWLEEEELERQVKESEREVAKMFDLYTNMDSLCT